jgi:hypothetical protein
MKDFGPVTTTQGFALFLAVLHHGFSCLAEGAIPAKSNTVLHTAQQFEDWLLERESV